MPIDRAATLRNAEKLLRQGKLDLAIAEYLRVVQEQPRDWNTGNILGDLYVRAGQIERAVDEFIRIADSLSEEGFLPKAGALYKKALKLKPDHEGALLQAAEIAAKQGLLVDARTNLNALAERRRARGDERGVAQIVIRLALLDPTDIQGRLAAARARLRVDDSVGALRDLKALATELAEQGRQTEAIEALREAAVIGPEDEEIRARLLDVYLAAGDFVRARECASSVEQLKGIAARLDAAGRADEALVALGEAARLDASDLELRAHLARAYAARGDLASAAQYLTVDTAGDDPRLQLTVAEIQLRAGRRDEAFAILQRLLDQDVNRRQDIALLGWTLAEHAPELGYQLVELAADVAVRESDWASAAAGLQEFVTRVPNHIPALMRLIEICVDGGLEATMYSAQAQLADAYIAAGAASEARVLAEDLVAREPWERANIERFRRALVLMGDPDPDALIAERLSGQSPFMITDVSLGGDLPEFSETRARQPEREQPAAPPTPSPVSAPPAAARKSAFESGAEAIDLGSILADLERPVATKPKAYSKTESVEVDLSIVLEDIRKPRHDASLSATRPTETRPVEAPPAETPPVDTPPVDGRSGDIDTVFAQMRNDASPRSAMEAAQQHRSRGMAFYKAGMIDEAIPELQKASRAPSLRFETASLLGRIHRGRGAIDKAVEWLEKAAQAPAPTPDEGHLLLYELADSLETIGEIARALAVCLELQAEAGEYRDVSARIDRLAKVQAGG